MHQRGLHSRVTARRLGVASCENVSLVGDRIAHDALNDIVYGCASADELDRIA